MKPGMSMMFLLMAMSATGTAIAKGASLAAAASAPAVVAAAPVKRDTSRLGNRIDGELADRQAQLDQRMRALDLREKAAKAVEARLATRAAVSSGVSGSGALTQPVAEDGREARLASLAVIYQAMKPKLAAPILEQLPADVQLGIARAMRERSLASIMTYMKPDMAARLSAAMAGAASRKPQIKP